MLAMPFAFYLSAKDFGLFFIGILDYILILFTGSRGGMLFGIVELIICIVVMFILDKRHRPAIAAIIGVSLVVTCLTYRTWFDTLSYTLLRLIDPDENSIRIQLIGRGIEDFKANPLFGRGIGYMGNRDVHKSADFALCWYHCSPVQIIGSFGICGIAAYGYLIYLRIKTLLKSFTFFNIVMFISYIGLELMSLVNPGIFAPFPYLFLITLYFVMMEKSNNAEDKKSQEKSKIDIRQMLTDAKQTEKANKKIVVSDAETAKQRVEQLKEFKSTYEKQLTEINKLEEDYAAESKKIEEQLNQDIQKAICTRANGFSFRKLCSFGRLCAFWLILQLAEAASEIPTFGFDPCNEFVPETVDIHV
jgi:hypothetical protein